MIDIKKLENIILKKHYHSYICCFTAYWNMIGPQRTSFEYYYELLSYMEEKDQKRKYTPFIIMFSKMGYMEGMDILIRLLKYSNNLIRNPKRKNILNSIQREYLINYIFNWK